MKLYAAKSPLTIFEQVNHCTTMESRWKMVQFASLFQILQSGGHMVEFEARQILYKFFAVLDLPSVH